LSDAHLRGHLAFLATLVTSKYLTLGAFSRIGVL